MEKQTIIRTRFAPTPSGRMHLGNAFAALLCWLDARAMGATLVLRMEDLDRARCRPAYAAQLLDDLRFLGLDWDEGYSEGDRTYLQSERGAQYAAALETLRARGLLYPCYCKRSERLAASAPHASDGTVRYDGRCRDLDAATRASLAAEGRQAALRIRVPEIVISCTDGNYGAYSEQLARGCGDFILRRADGIFAYQLAVVVDDALMGIHRVVRGHDLLASTARQLWLFEELGYEKPSYCHLPLLVDAQGRRLSKRDRDLDMGALRMRCSRQSIIGALAYLAGLIERPEALEAEDLIAAFSWEKIGRADRLVDADALGLLAP